MNKQKQRQISTTSKPGAIAANHAALTIAITSGKGGVGKTNIATNLGIALAKAGKKVCIFDADTSLANINILLGLTPEKTLEHFLKDQLTIDEILLEGPEGIQIVPAATGIADFFHLNKEQQNRLSHALEQLEQQFDYILIDTAAGISDSIISFIQSAQYAIAVISPEPTSLTDAFSLIKVLTRRGHTQPIYILVNMANNYAHSMEIFKRFAHAVNRYIEIKVRYLGYIPMDKAVRDAVLGQSPITISDPESPAGRCIELLANILLKHFTNKSASVRKISQFWRSQSSNNAPTVADDSSSTDQYKPEPASDKSSSDASTQSFIKENLTQENAETLLADLIQYYLGEFGTLPTQAIDLILQAHAQGELPDTAVAALQGKSTTDHLEQQNTSADELPPVETIQAQIDDLVFEAEQTKQQLTDLAKYIKKRYRELYNIDISRPPTPVRSLDAAREKSSRKRSESDTELLLQTIQYAAAVDQKPE